MDEEQEQIYLEGQRSVWQSIHNQALLALGYTNSNNLLIDNQSWIAEREEIINILRKLCRDFGDNDWDTNLNLADVIDKHLGNYLYCMKLEE